MTLIVIAGLVTSDNLTVQALLFSILGAFLQTAILGIIYEVLLRDEVENTTLEKLNLSTDVKRHGLVRMDDDASIDWPSLLDHGGDICVITGDPGRLLGAADNRLLEKLQAGKRRSLTIAVPRKNWDQVEKWAIDFEERWKVSLPEKTLMGIKVDTEIHYEIVASGDMYVLVLPPAGKLIPGSSRLLEFRDSGKEGIGRWLKEQIDQVRDQQAAWGHAPSAQTRRASWAPADTAPEEIS